MKACYLLNLIGCCFVGVSGLLQCGVLQSSWELSYMEPHRAGWQEAHPTDHLTGLFLPLSLSRMPSLLHRCKQHQVGPTGATGSLHHPPVQSSTTLHALLLFKNHTLPGILAECNALTYFPSCQLCTESQGQPSLG
jgi:hypothetical protein